MVFTATKNGFLAPAVLAAALLLLLAAGLAAQRYHTQGYSIRNGLPAPAVYAVTQDFSGRVWMAGKAGVTAFDGDAWEVFDPDDERGDEYYTRVRCDDRGAIWAATQASVSRLKDGVWTTLPPFTRRTDHIANFPLDLLCIDVDGETRPMVVFDDGRSFFWEGDAWRSRALGSAQGTRAVHATLVAGNRVLVATRSDGFYALDPRTGAREDLTPIAGEGDVQGLAYDPCRDQLWIIRRMMIERFDAFVDSRGAHRATMHTKLNLLGVVDSGSPLRVAADGRGGVYFGHEYHLGHADEHANLTWLRRSSGLLADGTTSLLLDREQNLWIASHRGVTKLVSRSLASFDTEHGLLDDEVTAITELKGGGILLGHSGGFTWLSDGDGNRLEFSPDRTLARVMDMDVGPDGTVWFACDFLGMGRIHGRDHIEWIPQLPAPLISTLRFDDEGVLWVGTYRGVFRYAGGHFESAFDDAAGNLSHMAIRYLARGREGRMYAACMFNGIIVFEREAPARVVSGGATSTYTVLEATDGRVWVGASDGLYVMTNGALHRSTTPDVSCVVYSLAEDSRGRLWIGTDNGVFRWDGERLDHFNAENGLAGNEANRAAMRLDSGNRLWIGTDRGVSVYGPDDEIRVSYGPSVEWRGLDADGRRHTLSEDVLLDGTGGVLTFAFRAISFVDERRVRFRTRLIGFNDDWSTPQILPHREIRFTNLTAGDYYFEIEAIDVNGMVGRVLRTPKITIRESLTQRTWFRVAAGGVALALGFIVFIVLHQRRYARLLESQIRARTEELQAAERTHARVARLDSLGVLAGGIAHDFNNLLTAILGNLGLIARDPALGGESRDVIAQTEMACAKAESLTRQLLTFARGGTPVRNVVAIESIIQESAELSLRGSAVRCVFDFAEELPPVDVDVGQFDQVFSNLFINARQAMPNGGIIRVRARPERDGNAAAVLIEITDQGCGIPANLLPLVFDPYFTTKADGTGLGLAVVHSIVHKHDARISVHSEEGAGATFRLLIPAAVRAPAGASRHAGASARGAGRVLVMDDNDAVRRFLKRALETLGYSVTESADGAGAVEIYIAEMRAERPFRAVLMDLTVPGGMGGLEATRLIMAADPGARIIVTSGYSQDDAIADYEGAGFRDRLPKPFTIKDLAHVVQRVVRS